MSSLNAQELHIHNVSPKRDEKQCSNSNGTIKFGSYFGDRYLEQLYIKFSLKQKRDGLIWFLLISILFDIYVIVAVELQRPILSSLISVLLLADVVLWLWCEYDILHKVQWCLIPHLAFQIHIVQLIVTMSLSSKDVISRDMLGWCFLVTYGIYVVLPLRFLYCCLLSCELMIIYNTAYVFVFGSEVYFYHLIIANNIMLITANLLGTSSYLVEDKQQRRAFLETKQSLEMKVVVEQQSAEQEQLLLSVLPEHVALQMRQDMDRADSQFKKIYMSRHENVSILYADIVGFTAISSTYSAQDLVKMLNELFARFDKLAEKYHQLRIKILGDCYYCISGAPIERPDHAVLCVHMGLSMVDAIKYVQKTTNSPVDMRVGIHTGAILAGVLGQRQWQFDVYSKDVELANKMESSGLAGRVHISATTLSFLKDEFEVEPAYGEKREEALRMAGLKTYFIVRVQKVFQVDTKNGVSLCDKNANENEEQTEKETETMTPLDSSKTQNYIFNLRLQEELTSRNSHKELAKNSKLISLHFTKPDMEKAYQNHLETFSGVTWLLIFLTKAAIIANVMILMPIKLITNVYFILENVYLLMIFLILLLTDYTPQKFCKQRVTKKKILIQQCFTALCILSLGLSNTFDSVLCMKLDATSYECSPSNGINNVCLFSSYFSYFALFILITSSIPASLPYLWKTILMIILTCFQCCINVFILHALIDCEELRNRWNSITTGKHTLTILLVGGTIALTLLARHMEKVARVLFLRKCEVESQRDYAADMARRNEALVYNILPPHVAAHFIGNKTRKEDDLYSQSYAEVGVLFASMPNFTDFYSEESVNNQGLECLRFLNEVISDFDALLELPRFHDIIKIKTIGSTYMAASGLNSSQEIKSSDPILVRWRHLSILVEFALELKKALQGINEQSFNHFVLKMGINHGPITAGVIGARKPHYDIWGNTVNVASRMESTGKAGYIQVTEETCEILKEFGYKLEQRGLVAVKGKGQLMTYYLQGSAGKNTPPTAPVSPIVSTTALEVVSEEDESHTSLTSKSEDKTVIEATNETYRSVNFNSTSQYNESDPLLGGKV